MFPLLETICLAGGSFRHLSYHQKRMTESARLLFGRETEFSLTDVLDLHSPDAGVFKCRVLYHATQAKVELEPYRLAPVRSLQCIEANDLDYALKYSDRNGLEALFLQRGAADDVLITQQGYVKDTSYGNICFLSRGQWYTPERPLLRGVMRQVLLDTGQIQPAPIRVSDIHRFSHFKVINAMRDMRCANGETGNVYR